MTYIPRGPKKSVRVTLSEDLVRTARDLSSDLSETIEKLLLQYVEAEQRRLDDRERRIDAALALIEAHQAEHGLWGEEFSTV